MVQIIENWAEMEGTVAAAPAPSDRPGLMRLELFVDSVRDVESFPNLLAEREHQRVEVLLPGAVPEALQEGSRVRVRVRRAPNAIFAHPEGVEPLS